MNVSFQKSVWLTSLGLFLIIFAIGNMFFGFTDAIADSIQLARLEPSVSLVHSMDAVAVDPSILPTTGSDKFAEDSNHPIKAQPVVENLPSIPALTPTAIPEPTPVKAGFVPDRIVISAIHLDAPIIVSQMKSVELKNQWFDQWLAPDEKAAGWQTDSAPLGIPGNTVLSGHHNEYGKVFGHLVELKAGDIINIYSGSKSFTYQVDEVMVLKERDVSLAIRQENAKWIASTTDERVTLVTCWPKRSNTHRLIVIAHPQQTSPVTQKSVIN